MQLGVEAGPESPWPFFFVIEAVGVLEGATFYGFIISIVNALECGLVINSLVRDLFSTVPVRLTMYSLQ